MIKLIRIAVVQMAFCVTGISSAQVYVFSPDLVIDEGRGLERFRGMTANRFVNCSNDQWNCYEGTVLNLIWPKITVLEVGKTYSFRNVRVEILSKYLSSGHLGSYETVLARNVDQNNIVYRLSGGCLTGVVIGSGNPSHLVARAKDGTLGEALRSNRLSDDEAVDYRLVTFDAPGGCKFA